MDKLDNGRSKEQAEEKPLAGAFQSRQYFFPWIKSTLSQCHWA